MNGPTQIGVGYAGMVTLVYLATDYFRNKAPFIFALPVAFLGLMTLTTTMAWRHKFFTSFSFFVMAYGLYHWTVTPKAMKLSALLICSAHSLYLFSFWRCIRKIWWSLAVFIASYMAIFAYYTFADLYRSYLTLISLCCLILFLSAINFVAAGSIWKYGSKMVEAQQAAFIRFLGLFLLTIFDCALMSDHFGRQTIRYNVPLNIVYFVSHFCLFFANEQAF